MDPAIGAVSVAGEDTAETESAEPAGETDPARPNHTATELDGSMPNAAAGSNETADGEKWGLPDDAGASSVSSTVAPAGGNGVASQDGSFVAAEPVSDEEAAADSSAAESGSDADEGIGRWAGTDDESTDTGGFEF